MVWHFHTALYVLSLHSVIFWGCLTMSVDCLSLMDRQSLPSCGTCNQPCWLAKACNVIRALSISVCTVTQPILILVHKNQGAATNQILKHQLLYAASACWFMLASSAGVIAAIAANGKTPGHQLLYVASACEFWLASSAGMLQLLHTLKHLDANCYMLPQHMSLGLLHLQESLLQLLHPIEYLESAHNKLQAAIVSKTSRRFGARHTSRRCCGGIQIRWLPGVCDIQFWVICIHVDLNARSYSVWAIVAASHMCGRVLIIKG